MPGAGNGTTAVHAARARQEHSDQLQVAELGVVFGGLAALDGVSLSVAHGEIVGVIGPNGAGKTTLFNVICGFVRPETGTITFRGKQLRRHQPHDLAKLGIARTLQGVGLFRGLTVVENVVAGAQRRVRSGFLSALAGGWRSSHEETALRRRALAILDEMGLGEYAGRFPGALPYGIQKRVALARALMSEPDLLLLDEPASGLSEHQMDDLGALIRQLRSRMGVLLVEHHMDLVMSTCDRIVVLNFGRVIAAGTPAEVQGNPEVTTAYLGEDVAAVREDVAAVRNESGEDDDARN